MGVKRKLVISTDSVGRWGRFDDWLGVWGWIRELEQFVGIEALAWRDSLDRFLQDAKQAGVKISGIHGRLGEDHRALLKIYDWMLVDTSVLLSSYSGRADYVLVHADEAEQLQKELSSDWAEAAGSVLMLENGGGEVQVRKAVNLIKKSDGGIRMGLMFDLYHYFGSLQGNVKERWGLTLGCLERILDEIGLVSLHLPIGSRLADSLPVEEMSEGMWQDLAGIIDGRIGWVTIENQQTGLTILRVRGRAIEKQRERNKRVIEILLKGGVV